MQSAIDLLMKKKGDLASELQKMKDSKMYSKEYIRNYAKLKSEEYKREVREVRDAIYRKKIEDSRALMASVKSRFQHEEPKAFTTNDQLLQEIKKLNVNNEKLVKMTRMGNRVKMMDDDELIKLAEAFDKNGDTSEYNQLELEVISQELMVRGKKNEAISFKIKLESAHLEEPWLNDPEYQKAEEEISYYEREINSQFIDIPGDQPGTGSFLAIDGELESIAKQV